MTALSISFVISLLIELVLPVFLAVYLVRRYKIAWLVILIGAGILFAVQFLQIPLLQWLTPLLGGEGVQQNPQHLQDALIMGFSTGVLVELLRFLSVKYIKQIDQGIGDAVGLGLGYAAVETILLVGVPMLVNFIAMLRVNSSTTALPYTPEVIEQIRAMWQLPWYLPLTGAYERLTALLMHVTLSVMVMQVFFKNNRRWLFFAMLWHSLYEGLSYYLASINAASWVIIAILTLITAYNLIVLRKLDVFAFFRSGQLPGLETQQKE